MNSKLTIKVFVLFCGLVSLSADDTFTAKPKRCKVEAKQLDSIIEQLAECTDKKWQPLQPKSFLGKLVPKGFPKIHLLPNGSAKGLVSGAVNLLSNASNLFPTNLSEAIPNFLKKLIPKSLKNKPDSEVLTRDRSKTSYSELKLNERVCCLLYENICVRNKVVILSYNCQIYETFLKIDVF